MSQQPTTDWESQLTHMAAGFAYPATPDMRDAVAHRLLDSRSVQVISPLRRLAWVMILFGLVIGGLMAVPPVRAAVVEFLQIGAIRIWRSAPTATPIPNPPSAGVRPTSTEHARFTPAPLHLAGKTTIDAAQSEVDFTIRLPAYPADLGQPDQVYLQNGNGPLLILLWMESDFAVVEGAVELRWADGDYLWSAGGEQPAPVRLALYQLGPGVFASKGDSAVITETVVHGQRAVWVEGLHLLEIEGGRYSMVRMVAENVLVWTAQENGEVITYRLETSLPPSEALHIAESLR